MNLFEINPMIEREFQRMEDSRREWLKLVNPMDTITADALRQFRVSTNSELMASISSQSALQKISDQFRNDQEQFKRMLEPIDRFHKHFAVDKKLKALIDQTIQPLALNDRFAEVFKQADLHTNAWEVMAKSALASINQNKDLLAATGVERHMAQLAKSFNDVNKQWAIPKELTESVSSLKALQDSIGKLTLPTIDWSGAATLAQMLGKEGIASQLAALGIDEDGSLIEESAESSAPTGATQAEGIGFSRKTMELMALISLIAAFLIPYLQELSSNAWQAKTDAELAAHRQLLENHKKQMEALSNLIVKALQHEAKRSEERFVVLERVATIRKKSESGSAVIGKLLPREVVQAVSEDGKWIEVRYYDWLRQSYHTGWTLKKYFKRVPVNHNQVHEEK